MKDLSNPPLLAGSQEWGGGILTVAFIQNLRALHLAKCFSNPEQVKWILNVPMYEWILMST